MKIECIRTHHLHCKLDKSFGFSQWSYDQRNVLVIEIITDTGLSGWGECYGPAEVIQSAVSHFYAPGIVGMDVISSDVIWQHMWRSSLDFARGGVMMAAMSGIDMAIWDLKGKALDLSLSELMGGRHVNVVPCYATGMYFEDLPEKELLQSLVSEAIGYANNGFKAMKVKVGKNPDFDEKLIVAMRDALPEMKLMADSNHAYDLPEAIRIGKVLEQNNYEWFEEPLSPEHPKLFKQLNEKVDITLATGECEQTRFGFIDLINSGGVQLLQPDISYCGGPGEALKIRHIASAHGINVIPHVWGTMFNMAAATHFLATAYHEPGRQEPKQLLLEYDRTPNPLRDDIWDIKIEIKDGQALVPESAGLGVAINRDAMNEFDKNITETK